MAVLQDMTPGRLLTLLGEEIKKLFDGAVFPWQEKRESEVIWKPVQIFVQNMPRQDAQHRIQDMYPSVTVKIVQGFKADAGNFKGRVLYNCLCVFGVKDYRLEQEAWMDLFSMYERVYMRFAQNPMLGKYEETGDSAFELQTDDTQPYYFMACTLQFAAPEIHRVYGLEDDLT